MSWIRLGDVLSQLNEPPKKLSQIELQICELSNFVQLSSADRIAIKNWLTRLATHSSDQVGWRLIGELKEDLNGANAISIANPLGLLIYKIKACIPEICHPNHETSRND